MSMDVKNALPRIDKLRQIMKSRQGFLLTSDLAHLNIPQPTFRSWSKWRNRTGLQGRVSVRSAFIEDELFSFQSKYGSTIFSHETASILA